LVLRPAAISRGSPPRAWGRHDADDGGQVAVRFTPTCVGTAHASSRRGLGESVHPHVRGDGHEYTSWAFNQGGSPPRAWGRPLEAEAFTHLTRFTPTCVGTATSCATCSTPATVHPHVRGDGLSRMTRASCSSGSPPRAWGRLPRHRPRKRNHRFTPTCVGTACRPAPVLMALPVHPHVRGDGYQFAAGALPKGGSPPRAWGRLPPWRLSGAAWRFTPTCVGTAVPVTLPKRGLSVHPHVRGDGARAVAPAAEVGGSPPRAWGRRALLRVPPRCLRFTPTCVGTALPRNTGRGSVSVHPHVRGDGRAALESAAGHVGSPPRAWGRPRGLRPARRV